MSAGRGRRGRRVGRTAEGVGPDPAFYAAIGGDATVEKALGIFYDRIFGHPRLGRFFAGVDKETIRAKQQAFMKRCFLGECHEYMGQRPRNAHHRMVISDEEFDEREALMRRALLDAGLTPAQAERWIAVEEVFRGQIVKDRPRPLFYRGFATYWAEEERQERVEVGAVCDACGGEVAPGATLFVRGERATCLACREASPQ